MRVAMNVLEGLLALKHFFHFLPCAVVVDVVVVIGGVLGIVCFVCRRRKAFQHFMILY